MFNWTDDSAMWQLRYPETPHGESAERYVRARLQGWSQDEANEIVNGETVSA